LKDGVSHKGYDGEYDAEDDRRRRLGVGNQARSEEKNGMVDEKNGIAFGASYWTRLAVKNSGVGIGLSVETRLRSSMGGIKNAFSAPRRLKADIVEISRKLHFDQNIKQASLQGIKKIARAQIAKSGKVSHKNLTSAQHSSAVRVDSVSPNGLTRSTQQNLDIVQQKSAVTQVEEQKAVHYVQTAKVQTQTVGQDSKIHRRLGKHTLQIQQDDGLEYDMSKIFGSGKFVLPKVNQKEIDEMSSGDSAKLLAAALSLAKDDVSSFGALVRVGWGFLVVGFVVSLG
jgi:hypothetical protein